MVAADSGAVAAAVPGGTSALRAPGENEAAVRQLWSHLLPDPSKKETFVRQTRAL